MNLGDNKMELSQDEIKIAAWSFVERHYSTRKVKGVNLEVCDGEVLISCDLEDYEWNTEANDKEGNEERTSVKGRCIRG